jgi:hypothetical protein
MGKKLRGMKAKLMNRIKELGSEATATTATLSQITTLLELFYALQFKDEEKK